MTGLFADSGRMQGITLHRAADSSRYGDVISLDRGVHCSTVEGSIVLVDRFRVCPSVYQES